jgi:hypothetical protein
MIGDEIIINHPFGEEVIIKSSFSRMAMTWRFTPC